MTLAHHHPLRATNSSRRRTHAAPPLVIFLPDGLSLGGVSSWALRLAAALSGPSSPRPRRVCLLTHTPPPTSLFGSLDPAIELLHLPGLPPLRDAAGDLRPYIPAYLHALEHISGETDHPCIVAPTSLGDSFAIAAAISLAHPGLLRVVAWQHSDIPYDTLLLTHYEPLIASFVGVSSHITGRLQARLPSRTHDVHFLPYGVHVPPQAPPRADRSPTSAPLGSPERPIRLIYTGRLEHEQKRIGALFVLPRELASRNIHAELTLVGDGPALPELRATINAISRSSPVRLAHLPPVAPDRIAELLDRADAFLLPSRYEGLSVAMLEAMARACLPIVARVDSGPADAIEHLRSGLVVEIDPRASDADTAVAFAEAIAGATRSPAAFTRMAAAAHAAALERFSIQRHAQRVSDLLDRAAAAPTRSWPTDRPCAFTASTIAGSGTVPPDAHRRLADLLASITADRRIMLHGAGRHTIELAPIFARSPAPIVGVIDDDPAKWGTHLLGWTVLSPADALAAGATDLIISSWLHADGIYDRRGFYEPHGLRVHHLYR